VIERQVQGKTVRLLRPEPELAIILFHNMFPERTYQLEHFYMPLYYLSQDGFELDLFIQFAEENRLDFAIRTNLTLISELHQACFGSVPAPVIKLLTHWGRNLSEAESFEKNKLATPFMFSPRAFWTTFLSKLGDGAFTSSLFAQGLHMLNPVFMVDVIRSLAHRFSENGIYHLE
jgi:hypothetical protein